VIKAEISQGVAPVTETQNITKRHATGQRGGSCD
jgi:hypothetical protein